MFVHAYPGLKSAVRTKAERHHQLLKWGDFYGSWQPSSGHKSGWRVCCGAGNDFRQLVGQHGRLILFKSMEAAQKRADQLNTLEQTSV